MMTNMKKVIAAMTVLALTSVPAVANNDACSPRTKVAVAVDLGGAHVRYSNGGYDRGYDRSYDRGYHRRSHRPMMETVTFHVSRHTARHKNVEAAAMSVRGVRDARWNPRSETMTVRYDARRTSSRIIKDVVRR